MTLRRARAAKIAASLQMLARSAPARPAVWRASVGRSTVGASGLLRVWTLRIASRPPTPGGETKIWRSKRPGRSSAGSSFSSRLEAAMTTRSPRGAEAVHLHEQLVERLLALGVVVASRAAPTASISSMKMIAGRALRASANSRRMRAAPRPANISTNEAADWEKNWAPDSWATALASSVLPVPGGPWSRMPFGTVAPSAAKRFGSRRNSTTSAELRLGLVGPGDVRPADRGRRTRA